MIDVETEKVGSYMIRIVIDEDPMDPRDGDGFANLVMYHSRYNLPNDVDFPFRGDDYGSWEEIGQALRDDYGAALILPVFMFDHSGVSYRTEPYGDRWDSGQVGFIFATDAQIREWQGLAPDAPITPEIEKLITDGLRAEVDEYSAWAGGEVYGYIIETAETTFKLEADGTELAGSARIVAVPPGEHVDSCWGFIGDVEYCLTEARAAVPD